MKKGLSVATKLHIPIFLSLIFGLLALILLNIIQIGNIEKRVYTEELKKIKRQINSLITEKLSVTQIAGIGISEDGDLKEALIKKDRKLALKKANQIVTRFKKDSKFKNVMLAVHEKNGINFIRQWKADLYGDKVINYKSLLKYALENKKSIAGIEIGKFGIAVRSQAPVFNGNKEILGTVEFILDLKSIISDMKKLQSDILVAVNEQCIDIAKYVNYKLPLNINSKKLVICENKDEINKDLLSEIKNITGNPLEGFVIGKNYFITSVPLKSINGKIIGYIIIGKHLSDINQAVESAKSAFLKQTISMIGVDILVFILMILAIHYIIKKQLSQLLIRMKDLAEGEADLTKRVEIKTKDEFEEVGNYVNTFIEKVEESIEESKSVAKDTSKTLKELTQIIEEIEKGTEEEKSIVEKTTKISKEMQTPLEKTQTEVIETFEEISKANQKLEDARTTIKNLLEQIKETSEEEKELVKDLEKLSEQADEAKKVLDLIKDIANQTNLLALNAAIEAARAGEYGKGFSVVADEVRNLAEKTRENLEIINATINKIVDAIKEVVEKMHQKSEKVKDLVENSEKVEHEIEEVVETMGETSQLTKEVAETSSIVLKDVSLLIKEIEKVYKVANTNIENVENMTKRIKILEEKIRKLEETLNRFKTQNLSNNGEVN